VADLFGFFKTFSHWIRSWMMSALLVALQYSVVSKGLSWTWHKFKKTRRPLTGSCHPAMQSAGSVPDEQEDATKCRVHRTICAGRLHKVCRLPNWLARDRSAEASYMELSKEQLGDWEVLDYEPPSPNDSLNCTAERMSGLVREITQLIDSCEGLGCVDWDKMIAILEGEANYNTTQGICSADNAERVESGRLVARDDWELVR
jgi:hypothetical protein